MIKFTFGINENNEIIHNKNRGLTLEQEINESNNFYIENNVAIIHKKATPVTIVKCVDNKIIEGYFEEKSTTDYNGVYKGRYIDFEAKSTQSKTSFPLSNIRENQITHSKQIIQHKGVSFFLIEFASLQRYFILPTIKLLKYIDEHDTSSIPLAYFITESYELKRGLNPPLNYIDVIKTHLSDFLL